MRKNQDWAGTDTNCFRVSVQHLDNLILDSSGSLPNALPRSLTPFVMSRPLNSVFSLLIKADLDVKNIIMLKSICEKELEFEPSFISRCKNAQDSCHFTFLEPLTGKYPHYFCKRKGTKQLFRFH